jgi:hypothetical protein
VNAYYAGPVAVPAQPTSATQPQPVVVNVNNASGYQTSPTAPGASTPRPVFNADSYAGYAQTATQIATQAAPYMPGAVAGAKAAKGMGLAKESFAKAARSRSPRIKANAGSAGRGLAFGGIMSAVKSSVLFNGLISLGLNGYKVYKKEQGVADAGANVTGDIASAAVGGAAGAAASAAGTALLAGVIGTGFPLTLVGLGLGIGGYMLADTFFRKTALFQNIKTGVKNMLSKVTG